MSNTPFRVGDRETMPDFKLPAPAGTVVAIQTYVGHDPDDKKMDMYFAGWPDDSAVVAAADGTVCKTFYPGGIQIDHGHGWASTYMHMDRIYVSIGQRVASGQKVGRADTVGTGAKHLHHEHLYRADGDGAHADTVDMVNPIIQGIGPMMLVPNGQPAMTSINLIGAPPIGDDEVTPEDIDKVVNGVLAGLGTDDGAKVVAGGVRQALKNHPEEFRKAINGTDAKGRPWSVEDLARRLADADGHVLFKDKYDSAGHLLDLHGNPITKHGA